MIVDLVDPPPSRSTASTKAAFLGKQVVRLKRRLVFDLVMQKADGRPPMVNSVTCWLLNPRGLGSSELPPSSTGSVLLVRASQYERLRNEAVERFANGGKIKRWEPFRRQAEKRLRILETAKSLGDLAALHGNRLERLKGDRKGQHSIRINGQWCIGFVWRDGEGAYEVEICDYH